MVTKFGLDDVHFFGSELTRTVIFLYILKLIGNIVHVFLTNVNAYISNSSRLMPAICQSFIDIICKKKNLLPRLFLIPLFFYLLFILSFYWQTRFKVIVCCLVSVSFSLFFPFLFPFIGRIVFLEFISNWHYCFIMS